MRNSILLIAFMLAGWHNVYSQQHISQKEIDLLNKNAKEKSLLNSDPDFKDSINDNKWENESAVILCQKLTFEFDKKEITVKKKTKNNPFDSLFRSFKSNDSIYADLFQKPDIRRTEEKARRTILLKDKCAVDTYSKVYFRLASKDDAFAARVIKKDGSKKPIIIDSNAVRIYDIRNIPDIFKSYTDRKFSAIYRPSYYKLDVSDLQEGDILEFEFVHLNAQQGISSPEHKDFNQVYYLCNKSVPVVKQVVEVITSNDQYKIAYKNPERTPSFTKSKKNGKKIYRWEDNYNNNSDNGQNANETINGSSFQVIYAKSTNKDFSKLNTENNSTQNVDISKFEEKVTSFWFDPKSIHSSSAAAKDIQSNINSEAKTIYRSFKENGITDNTDEEYVRKAYYAIRAKTIYNAWSDYMFAKVLANLIEKKKLAYEVIVTTSNQKASIEKVSMTPQLSWLIKFGKNYFPNPYEHGNPSEFPEWLSGSSILHFDGHKKSSTEIDSLPANDTANNALIIQIHAWIDSAKKQNIFVDKTTEAKGFIRDAMIDDALAYTAFLETDYKAYDAVQMWQGLDDKKQFQAVSNFNSQRKKWKEEKPQMMKEMLQKDYGFNVANYNSFLVIQDGRIYKKSAVKYNETFSLGQMISAEDSDIVVKLPSLIGIQPQVSDQERTSTDAVNLGYPSTVKWQIGFQIPKGYKAVDVFDLGTYIDNDYATFEITVNVNAANTLMLDITKVYKTKHVDAESRSQMLEVLDAVYKFSQSKIVLRKK